jgi:hypothetical protein
MTIPIQTPQIQPPLAPPPPTAGESVGEGLKVVAMALQRRQELELARQKLAQEQQQFEIQKKILGSQFEGQQLENEKKKREFKTQDEELAAEDQANRIFIGNLPTAHDMNAWGQVMANVKDPKVGAHLMAHIQGMFELQGKAGTAESTDLKNQQTILGMAEDRQIHGILQGLAGREWNRTTIGKVVGRIMAINPEKAGHVATTLNSMLPDYQIVLNPDGTVGYAAKQPGDASLGVKPPRPTDEQNKLATYAVRVLEANATMTDLENKHPGIGQKVDDRIRALRGIEQIPALGRAAATVLTPQFLRGLSSEERRYVNARVDLGNAILRRASGAQINMEELDRETAPYVPTFRQQEDVVPSIQQRRLQQGLLFSEQAGAAFNPNRLSPGARRYLLENIAPHPGYSPDNPFLQQPGTTVVPR